MYVLPEAQLDRFMLKVTMGYPSARDEEAMLQTHGAAPPAVPQVAALDEVRAWMAMAEQVHASPTLQRYIVALARWTRAHASIVLGASPRAALALAKASRARALLEGEPTRPSRTSARSSPGSSRTGSCSRRPRCSTASTATPSSRAPCPKSPTTPRDPWLSPSGRAVLLVAAMVALTGVWLETAGLVVVAELILAAMAWLYLRALLLADEVERGRIRVHIELPEGTRSEARVGDSVALDVVVENLSGYWLPHAEVEVSSPSGLRWPALNRGAPRVVDFGPVAPGSAARARVEVRAQRAGRWLVPGAELTSADTAGWVRSASWLPSGLSLVVRPGRGERLGGRAVGRRKVLEQLPAGRQRVDRPGDGYDIRQLRTYVVGDDPRRIAWKATARRGRLMVRQHEDEVSDTVLFVLDASGTMRGGTDGAKWRPRSPSSPTPRPVAPPTASGS